MTDRGRTSLTPYAASMRDPDPAGAHRIAKQRWHEKGDIVLFAEDIDRLDWQDRELVKAIAAKRYGSRGGSWAGSQVGSRAELPSGDEWSGDKKSAGPTRKEEKFENH